MWNVKCAMEKAHFAIFQRRGNGASGGPFPLLLCVLPGEIPGGVKFGAENDYFVDPVPNKAENKSSAV